jgi:hypothetical protein
VDPAVNEIVSLIRDGGGTLAIGAFIGLAYRLVKKVEDVLDGVKTHRERQVAHFEATETHLAALHKALAS